MPELPEVETIVRGLVPAIRGRVIERAELLFKPLLRRGPKGGLDVLAGRKVLGVRRRGKMALIECEGGITLVFHLKMTGQLLVAGEGAEPPDKHTRLVIRFRDRRPELRFRDVRKFGFLVCVAGDAERGCEELACLGPEPLGLELGDFAAALGKKAARIKGLLLDQSVIAGIGNIYADEMLFEAGIHPETPAVALSKRDVTRLWEAMGRVLRAAIEAKGSSLRDYVDAEGQEGEFQESHKVYGREGEPCARCGGPIKRKVVAGRGTHFCPRCQRKKQGTSDRARAARSR